MRNRRPQVKNLQQLFHFRKESKRWKLPEPILILLLFVPAKEELPLAELKRLGIRASKRAREGVMKNGSSGTRVVRPTSCASLPEEAITFEIEEKSLKQMRQIHDLITAPLEDFDLVVLDKTARLATGEVVCDLIHPPTRIPKEPENDRKTDSK
jgi:hypothetical protein